MDTIKPLATSSAVCVGGRNGHADSNDGVIKVDLSVAKEMGGQGKPGATTPEHLFSAGYAACFGGAIDFVGRQRKLDASRARITCTTSVGPRDKGGFGIAIHMRVEDRSIPQNTLASIVQEAHEKVCPYSHATRGNVPVEFEVIGG